MARSCGMRPTRPTCWRPSARSRRCGVRSSARGRRATGGRGQANSATGAPTRPSARRSAVRRLRCRARTTSAGRTRRSQAARQALPAERLRRPARRSRPRRLTATRTTRSEPGRTWARRWPLLAKIAAGGVLGVPANNPYSFFVPGLLIQLGLFGAAFVGFTIIADWRAGVIERFRVTPVSRMALLVGRLLRDVLTLTVQATVLVLAGLAFGLRAPFVGVLAGIGFVAVVAVSLAAISYTL